MKLLCQSSFSGRIAKQIAEERGLRWRFQAEEFLRSLLSAGAWVIVFSASLIGENVIPFSLLSRGFTKDDNIRVVSNGAVMKPNGPFAANRERLITPLNKKGGFFLKHLFPVFPRSCLVIGDSLSDAMMADGLPFADSEVTKVAFGSPGRHRPGFRQKFDYVLKPDESFAPFLRAL